MQARSDLDELELVVRRRGGRYLAKISQIGLYATADSLIGAIESLEAKKKTLLDELTAADALGEIPAFRSGPGPIRMLPVLGLFATKVVIVLALVLFTVGLVSFTVQRQFERNIAQLRLWGNVIERATDPSADIPPAKRQALLDNLHVLVDRWRPFVKEASRLFSDQDAGQDKQR